MKKAAHRRLNATVAVAALLFAALFVGCGGSEESAAPPPDYAKLLAGSPPQLAALHEQGSELLDGGLDAYNQRLKELRGFPVVVNFWASWCGPCRVEIPMVQKASAKRGKRIAFLGVNPQDSEEFAKEFMEEFPVPFPSYIDPDAKIADDVGGRGYPRTAYYDKSGKLVYVHSGQYPDQESLEQDIQKYAVEGQSD